MRASEQACVESRMCKMERSSEWANENANASVCLKLRVSQEIKNACECGLLDVTLTHIHSLSLSLSLELQQHWTLQSVVSRYYLVLWANNFSGIDGCYDHKM